ncbi:MAG: NADH-quinone oxidoreductase subunit NuoH [bacterium]
MAQWTEAVFLAAIKSALVILVLLGIAAYLVLAERKILARLQVRYGPNRAGPRGVLQPLADMIKLLTKEDTIPAGADKVLFLMAPAVVAATVLMSFAVVPWGPEFAFGDTKIKGIVADVPVGVLYLFAMSSLAVYGVALGGWASNSKYSLLGGVRGAAQMISYELSMGLSLAPVVMISGSFSLVSIVEAQQGIPFALVQPVSLVLFFLSSMAETRRIPFDLPEAENELVAGYHTEYSGMRFGLFFLGEYVNILVLGALVATMFLGGWKGPVLPPAIWFLLKVTAVAFLLIWIRGTLPRFRYDQLMHLGWKLLLPASILNVLATGAILAFWES